MIDLDEVRALAVHRAEHRDQRPTISCMINGQDRRIDANRRRIAAKSRVKKQSHSDVTV
jgi:hypothetical protein